MTTADDRYREPHRIGVVVFDGVKMLDVAGASEVFSEARLMGARYEIEFCSVGARGVMSSIGIPVCVSADAADRDLRFDTVLVVGGDLFPTHPVDPELREAVRGLAARSGRVCSICTGAFILAEVGVLSGRRATTHWRHTGVLAASYPDITVEPDSIFVRDGNVFTSAGVSAGIDLALALLEEDHGGEMARQVARSLVVYLQRPGGQSQFSPTLEGPRPKTPLLRAVFDAVAADPAAEHTTQSLATRAAVSPRHLTRLFRSELQTTPSRYVESIRLDTAKAALEGGAAVTEAAQKAGFGSPETMRRVFVTRLGVSPRAYRQGFRSARREAPAEPGTTRRMASRRVV
ncbi:helix-turn-helix domain-containing protein [Nonomuraea phyllanthi]|uniref:Helix-turn-helix domain-containing protein n=2 Tax=Nonomuraea phyllanthi TaxID=2219224 RepID=A0A5C4VDV7_9ACTN|nr:GlxA family transcriptional regulator [Nonomuraea phyllanthi]KAB8188598.1 helix-turn-helix domain-containing protein [Nonomuraea phyllanthi]QFY14989.1 helix-turn-helix domain-containing protein [Nonomuraea phyllanthi]